MCTDAAEIRLGVHGTLWIHCVNDNPQLQRDESTSQK